ncbi:MAG: Uma2 family endonuclease [Chloroflexota bacterium]
MTTITEVARKTPATPRKARQPAEFDPYLYGWRHIPRLLPDGALKWERVPLTLADILHPQLGDYQTRSFEHARFRTHLYNVLRAKVATDPSAVVLSNVRVGWGSLGPDPHSPDIAVIFNVRQYQDWSTFNTAEEGTKPSLIIEITSPATRSVDLVDKFEEYAEVGVPYYVIVDSYRQRKEKVQRLLGYQLTDEGYVALPLDTRGRLWLPPVGLWLGFDQGELVCYDENDQRLENYVEINRARQREAQARAAAEERVRQLEEELRRLRGA